jgi:hypothetical protein
MKDFKLYLLGASILLVFYLIAQYNRPKAVDWSATLSKTDKIPYGTYVLYSRLNDIFPAANIQTSHDPVYNVLNSDSIKSGTYVIICNAINLNKYDFDKLKRFIKNGNNVFIAANNFGGIFREDLKIETQTVFTIGTNNVSSTFLNESIEGNKHFTPGKGIANGFFSRFDTTKAVALSKNSSEKINYLKYSFGKGSLYLNADPLMFTNYNMLGHDGALYVSIALSYLKSDRNLIWDEFYSQGRHKSESVMRVFLGNPALEWAFYISFYGILITRRAITATSPTKKSFIYLNTYVGFIN